MEIARASAVFRDSPEELWDFVFGDRLSRLVAASNLITAVDHYEMRSDGTPRYRMTMRVGPLPITATSDYSFFERPSRSVNTILDNPLGGTFVMDFAAQPPGTRLTEEWHVETNRFTTVAYHLLGPLLSSLLQKDFDQLASRRSGHG